MTDANKTTALVMVLIAFAVVLIGGLIVIPALQQAEAAKSETGLCASTFKNRSSRQCHRFF